MINKELVKCFINQLSADQLKRIVLEFVNHYELNDEYNLDTMIDGIVNIATKSAKIVDRADYLLVIKETPTLFANKETLSVVISYVPIKAFSIFVASVAFSIFSNDIREINLYM